MMLDGRVRVLLLIASFTVSRSNGLTAEQLAAFDNSSVTIELKSDGNYEFISTGYPDHEIDNSVNPNEATAQNFNYSIPSSPTTGDKHCTSLGPIGFAINGVAIYNALTGDITDAVIHEVFDSCKGHSSPDGAYHYHQFSGCVGSLEVQDQFLGVALDGHPIYGPKATDRTELLTSADLDACHGREVNGVYRYHITNDFPYALGCYVSQPGSSNSGPSDQGGTPPGGDGGDGPPPPRVKRQIDTSTVTCANTDGGAQLCDCNNDATYLACDVAVAGGDCDGDGVTDRPIGSNDDDERTTTDDGNESTEVSCTLALVMSATLLSFVLL